jgi:hypothetical protein
LVGCKLCHINLQTHVQYTRSFHTRKHNGYTWGFRFSRHRTILLGGKLCYKTMDIKKYENYGHGHKHSNIISISSKDRKLYSCRQCSHNYHVTLMPYYCIKLPQMCVMSRRRSQPQRACSLTDGICHFHQGRQKRFQFSQGEWDNATTKHRIIWRG